MKKEELTSSQSIAKWSGILVIGFLLFLSNRVSALSTEFFIGIDEQTTITSGDYAGLANPNEGRLTLLFAHPARMIPVIVITTALVPIVIRVLLTIRLLT